MKIVSDNKIPFLKGILEPYAHIEYYPGNEITNDKLVDADALITRTRTKCNSDLLNGTNIKLITTATIGYDHIDVNYCGQNNIKWLNAPGCNSGSVMQYVTTALLLISKKENFNLSTKTIGIIGVGNVGSKVQKVAEALGMKVLLNDPPRRRAEGEEKFCSIDEILEKSDIITIHVPLNREGEDKTFHLADDSFFDRLKNKIIFLNTSRGEVVNTSSIKKAIRNNKVSNTVIDVWENEPEIDLELLEMVNIATPHIAGYSADGKANGTSVCVNAVNNIFELGLETNWYPDNIPLAESGNQLQIDGRNKGNQDVLFEIITSTYLIMNDDEKLRNSASTFEKQRGNYPIRREFTNYFVQIENCNPRLVDILKKLGFNIKLN